MNSNTSVERSTKTHHPERVTQRAPTVTPVVDVFENAHEILLWADVPGATSDGIEVHVDKGQLFLSARRGPLPKEGEKPTGYDYYRVFTVPTGIDAAKIEAELSQGVLKVRLPKSEALKPRRIEVKAS